MHAPPGQACAVCHVGLQVPRANGLTLRHVLPTGASSALLPLARILMGRFYMAGRRHQHTGKRRGACKRVL